MHKSLTRLMGIVLGSVLLISSFAGCGSTQKPDSTSETGTAAASPTPVKMEKIRVWTGSGSTKEIVPKLVEEYNNSIGKEKGIQIEYTVYGGDYQNILDVALASMQAAEIVNIPGGKFVPIVKKNVLMSLEELPGGTEFLKKYEGRLRTNVHTVNGKVYSVPFNMNTMKLVYNKDLFKKAGIVDANGEAKPPVTWAEVAEYAKKITNPAEKTYGIVMPFKWTDYVQWEVLFPFISSIGHTPFDHKTGKFNYTAFKPVVEWWMQINKDKSYFPGPEGLDNDPARAQFAEGRIGMKFAASWDVGVYNDQFPAKCDWGVANIPVLDVNNRYKDYMVGPGFFEVTNSANDANKEKVMEVYKWLNDDAFLTKMYEESKFIPYNSDIIKNAKKQPVKKGWKEFAQVETGYMFPQIPTVSIEGDDFKMVFMKIWSGRVSIDEGLADLDKRYNSALEKDAAAGKIKVEEYIDKDIDTKIK